jgi:hypothetical protein
MPAAPDVTTLETHLAHARSTPDYLSGRSTRELKALFRATPTLPFESLLNDNSVRIDAARRRVWRDGFWKGTFARDRLLGLDERWMAPADPAGLPYTGGRFWKRFDRIDNGVARGLIVNYSVSALPGHAYVQPVPYPDDRRSYVAAGDTVLLLRYRNHLYRVVYDLIKIVAPDAAIGIMHLGTFPNGMEFTTFVMARNNYPFAHMAVPDHDRLFDDAAVSRVPAPAELAGRWRGRVVFSRSPDRTMHNQFNLPIASAQVDADRAAISVWWSSRRGTLAPATDALQLVDTSGHDDLRAIGSDTLLGRRYRSNATEPATRYVLSRAASEAVSQDQRPR